MDCFRSPKQFLISTIVLAMTLSSLQFNYTVLTADSNVYVHCSQHNFTSMALYGSNVHMLFASLIDSASLYNFDTSETSPQSDSVYGLFQCRGDLSSTNCKDCVTSSISQLMISCPSSKGSEIQLDGCFVKYNDMPFFGGQNKVEVYRKCGPSVGSNIDVLNLVDDALANLVGKKDQYFRGGDFGGIHSLAQCIQDLSLSDCQDCLSEARGRLRSECARSTWADMYLGKCYIRYVEQGNLDNPDNHADPSSKKKSGKWSMKKTVFCIIGAVISLYGIGHVTIACTCFTKKVICYNNNNNNNVSDTEVKVPKKNPGKKEDNTKKQKKHEGKEDKKKEIKYVKDGECNNQKGKKHVEEDDKRRGGKHEDKRHDDKMKRKQHEIEEEDDKRRGGKHEHKRHEDKMKRKQHEIEKENDKRRGGKHEDKRHEDKMKRKQHEIEEEDDKRRGGKHEDKRHEDKMKRKQHEIEEEDDKRRGKNRGAKELRIK